MNLVDIDDYKIIKNYIFGGELHYLLGSGKSKIDGKNGIGREYLIRTNNLIFEGEYINGKKNGKGKEYYNDTELNEEKSGKKNEYYKNIKIKFEGEYQNGKKMEK